MRGVVPALVLLVAAGLGACAEGLSAGPGGGGGDPGAGSPPVGPGSTPEEVLAATCDAELQLFERTVLRPILSARCTGCHNPDGMAAGSRMVLVAGDGAEALGHNYAQVHRVATTTVGGLPLLLSMPSDRNPERHHPGGRLVTEGSPEYAALEALVGRIQSPGCDAGEAPRDCSSPEVAPRRLVRLTPAEIDRAVQDLLGVAAEYSASLPADPVVDGFANNAAELRVTPLWADKAQAAAEDVAARADLAPLLPCSLEAADATCARSFISAFGERTFRRPLGEADVSRYAALYDVTPSFEAGTRLVIAAMLQSPHFLYRFELGTERADGLFALSDHEVATGLSFLVWGTTPDAELLTAAREGRLHTPEQIAEEVERLGASERARPMLTRFVVEWLGLSVIDTVPKDGTSFPELTQDVRTAMRREVEAFVSHIAFERGGTLGELLESDLGFVDPALAAFYGIDAAAGTPRADGLVQVTVPERSGLLTLGGVMLTHARSNDSSPIHRGRLVRDRLLCQPPSPPPPGINAEPPPMDPSLTVRERYAAHSREEPCQSCHRLLDPIGFSFEHFDGVGRFRATENGHVIDASGEITSTQGSDATFEGTHELAALLAASPDVAACFSRQWFRFAFAATDTGGDACTVESLGAAALPSALPLRELFARTTSAPRFTLRARASTPDPGAPPGSADGGAPPPPPPPLDAGSVDAGPEPPPPPTGLALERIEENDWGGGYCYTYRVTNTGTDPLDWSVSLEVDGTLSNSWESQASGTTGTVVFTGAAHNARLEPGGTAQFGFCANR